MAMQPDGYTQEQIRKAQEVGYFLQALDAVEELHRRFLEQGRTCEPYFSRDLGELKRWRRWAVELDTEEWDPAGDTTEPHQATTLSQDF